MDLVQIGRTGITTNKNGFGALPIQRIPKAEAIRLTRMAFDGGITWFDTAHSYTDSEEKLGEAFEGIRDRLFLATKTHPSSPEELMRELETSLRLLKTDHIDVYQFHNLPYCPRPGDEQGLYDAALRAQREGKIRFIGFTNHRIKVAREAVESGLYATLQYPFSYLASAEETQLVEDAVAAGMGFFSMKALAGGLITDSALAYAFQAQYPGVLPLWGIQRESELKEFLSYVNDPPVMTPERLEKIGRERKELVGEFCRGCGYCMPCPMGIQINDCARMILMLRRAPVESYTTPEFQEKMHQIENCLHCGQCASRCPYGLDTPALLQKNYEDYWQFVK